MPSPDSDNICPYCGGALRFEDKNTFTGREMREYRCTACGKSVVEDCGIALWQVLHDANEAAAESARRSVKKPWWKFWGKRTGG